LLWVMYINIKHLQIMTTYFSSIVTDIQSISGGRVSTSEVIRYGWIGMIAAGIFMFYFQNLVDPDNGAPTMALVTLGLFMLVYGACRMVSRRRVYHLGNVPLELSVLDFDQSASSEVMRCFSDGDFHHLMGIGYQQPAKIKVMFLHDSVFGIVYAQPFAYRPYDYYPCAQARLLDSREAAEVRELLRMRR